jgi:hypothetical protein
VALSETQRLGFAESDPSEHLSGRDAARKLQILVRHAFGSDLSAVTIQLLNESIVQAAREAATVGRKLRQVARAERREGGVAVSVGYEPTDTGSPFYNVSGEWNALTLTLASGEVITVCGRGAGRWPTTEAVMADVFTSTRGHSRMIPGGSGRPALWLICRERTHRQCADMFISRMRACRADFTNLAYHSVNALGPFSGFKECWEMTPKDTCRSLLY